MKQKTIGILAGALCGIFLLAGCTPTPTLSPSPTVSLTHSPTPSAAPLTGDNTRADTFGIFAYQPTRQDFLSEAYINGTITGGSLIAKSDYLGDYDAYLNNQAAGLSEGQKLLLNTRSIYYNVRDYQTRQEALYPYISNMLALREFSKTNEIPFYTLLSATRMSPGQPQSATTLSVQAFISLGLGASGVAWADYQKDMYAPLDEDGDKTVFWDYLRDINRRLKIFSDVMKDLTVECVYFQNVGDANLPPRPSTAYLSRLEYNIKSDIKGTSPLMMVELSGPDDAKYLYVVNLSTTQSCYPRYTFRAWVGVDINNIQRLSPATGNWHVLNVTQQHNTNAQITEIGVHNTCITAGSAELYKIK